MKPILRRVLGDCRHSRIVHWQGRMAPCVLVLALFAAPLAAEESYSEKDLAKLEKTTACVKCNLAGVNLRGKFFKASVLNRTDFSGADLSNAMLSKAKLNGANLKGATLHSTNFHKAELREANLQGADLTKSKLAGADLRNADLSGATLRSANLKNAELTNANLSGADLTGASGLTAYRIGLACGDAETKLPKKLEIKPCSAAEQDGTATGQQAS